MKLRIYFRDELKGEIDLKNGLAFPNNLYTASVMESFQRRGLDGEELLKYMSEHLHGNTWCELIEDNSAPKVHETKTSKLKEVYRYP